MRLSVDWQIYLEESIFYSTSWPISTAFEPLRALLFADGAVLFLRFEQFQRLVQQRWCMEMCGISFSERICRLFWMNKSVLG